MIQVVVLILGHDIIVSTRLIILICGQENRLLEVVAWIGTAWCFNWGLRSTCVFIWHLGFHWCGYSSYLLVIVPIDLVHRISLLNWSFTFEERINGGEFGFILLMSWFYSLRWDFGIWYYGGLKRFRFLFILFFLFKCFINAFSHALDNVIQIFIIVVIFRIFTVMIYLFYWIKTMLGYHIKIFSLQLFLFSYWVILPVFGDNWINGILYFNVLIVHIIGIISFTEYFIHIIITSHFVFLLLLSIT